MSATAAIDDSDVVRSRLYMLLGRLLARPPDDAILQVARDLDADGTDTPLGEALAALSGAVAETDPEAVAQEYQALFIGVGRGELVPYASWYLTGFIGERPLVRLREDMAALGIARAEDVREPEDHIAALCEMMGGLIAGAFGEATDRESQAAFYGTHLSPWASQFFSDLEQVTGSAFYAAVGAVGHGFFDIESGLLLQPR